MLEGGLLSRGVRKTEGRMNAAKYGLQARKLAYILMTVQFIHTSIHPEAALAMFAP